MPTIGHARRIGVADEILERRNEGVILVGAMARAGDQPAVAVMHIAGKLHAFDMVGSESEAPVGQKPGEHLGVVAGFRPKGVGRLACLEDADPHGVMVLWLTARVTPPAGAPQGAGRAGRDQTVSR